VLLAQGEALFAARGPEAARAFLEPLVQRAPDLSDAGHMLAEVLEDLGDERGAIEQHLRTLRLDTQLDALSGEPEPKEIDAIAEVAEATLGSLPETTRQRLGDVAVLLEARPSQELVASGFDSRALGLFEGPTSVEMGMMWSPAEPTRIVLFTHCLLDAFGGDDEELREQVRITVLHEVGHYLGLEEEDMVRLGLD
jgi:predicted Zn-dependent protease with MMP-like domain